MQRPSDRVPSLNLTDTDNCISLEESESRELVAPTEHIIKLNRQRNSEHCTSTGQPLKGDRKFFFKMSYKFKQSDQFRDIWEPGAKLCIVLYNNCI